MKRLLYLAAFSVCASALAGTQDWRLDGIVTFPNKTLFAVTDTATKESAWLTIGGKFCGFEITSFDAEANSITLEADGQRYSLRLHEAGVRKGEAPKQDASAPWRIEAEALANNRPEVRDLLEDYDQVAGEIEGLGIVIDFMKKHPSSSIPAEEMKKRREGLEFQREIKIGVKDKFQEAIIEAIRVRKR